MDLGLKGKAVLVSGASRGIGNRIALAFAEEGARLCLSGRTEDTLRAAVDAVAAAGAEDVAHYVGDMTQTEAAQGFVDTATERFGAIDALVNNVGGSVWTPFAEITDDEWLHVFDLSFFSAVRVSRAAFPALEKNGGSITNISSIFGRESGGPISYNAAKAAMISMTANLAREAAAKGVRVNSVAPGSIVFPGGSWERRQKEDPEGIGKFVEDNIPFGRFGTPEEVAAVTVFLASERASWVTGTCLNVDGGQSSSNI
jgi:3-oxoacyl-[acyl-carrier protein] reductase